MKPFLPLLLACTSGLNIASAVEHWRDGFGLHKFIAMAFLMGFLSVVHQALLVQRTRNEVIRKCPP